MTRPAWYVVAKTTDRTLVLAGPFRHHANAALNVGRSREAFNREVADRGSVSDQAEASFAQFGAARTNTTRPTGRYNFKIRLCAYGDGRYVR